MKSGTHLLFSYYILNLIKIKEVKIIMTESIAIDIAIEIVKEYGKGGYSSLTPDVLLEKLYKKLLELSGNAQR